VIRTVKAGVAALLAAALAAFALLVPSAAFAVDAPAPPEPSVLTAENAGSASLEQDGSRVTVLTDVDRAYVYVYPSDGDPVGVGWQEPAEGSFGIDLSLMPAGELTIVLLDADGAVLGWADGELAEADSHAPPAEVADPTEAGEGSAAVPLWPWLAGGTVAVLLVVAAALLLIRARARRDARETDAQGRTGPDPAGPDLADADPADPDPVDPEPLDP
jgi:hypothetical protein